MITPLSNLILDIRAHTRYICNVCKNDLRGVEWVHGLFLFPLVLGKM